MGRPVPRPSFDLDDGNRPSGNNNDHDDGNGWTDQGRARDRL